MPRTRSIDTTYYLARITAIILFVLISPSGILWIAGNTSYMLLEAALTRALSHDYSADFFPEIVIRSAEGSTVNTSTIITQTTSNNYPSIYPNPVGPTGKVSVSAHYTSQEGIASVEVDINGPNVGSAKLPPLIGSLSLSIVSGTMQNGTWNGTFNFPSHLPDGSYIYSLTTTDTSGNTSKYGPFSGIILDRYADDNGQESETKITSAIDGTGKLVLLNGTTYSSNMTFVFNGSDKTGVVLEFQCNMDDTILQSGHEHGFDPNMPMATYSTCLVPENIARQVTGNYTYADLAPGDHTFKVRVVDNEYNMDNSPDTFSWTILPPP
jgi:hypothetical protein